jgi:predicted dehydrogenase
VRIGVVGGGLIAQVAHLPALRALDARYELVALAEPDAGVREALARRYGIASHADHRELLDAHQLDALLVCSPNGTHARVTLDALDAGLHVLVEKPLALSPRDADGIVSRARACEAVVQVGYMKRYDPAYELLLEHAPEAGPLRLASTITVDPGIGTRLRPAGFAAPPASPEAAEQVADATGSDDPRHVRPYSDAFAGALVHDVNLVLGVAGREWRVTDAARADDGSLAYGAWVGGDARWTALWLHAPAAGTFSEELRLFGADGVLALRFPAPYHGSAPARLRIDGEPRRCWAPSANAYARSLEHFHACVTRGEPCRTPAEQGARDVALLAELYRAAIA